MVRKVCDNKVLNVSLSLGAPAHCPAVSVRPEPDPPRRRPAAAKSESSSSRHPESSLPLFTAFLRNLKDYTSNKKTGKTTVVQKVSAFGLVSVRRISKTVLKMILIVEFKI